MRHLEWPPLIWNITHPNRTKRSPDKNSPSRLFVCGIPRNLARTASPRKRDTITRVGGEGHERRSARIWLVASRLRDKAQLHPRHSGGTCNDPVILNLS